MLSKEEIEKQDREHIKKVLTENKNYIFEFDTDNIKTDDILEYIEQLETKLNKYESREQKLIEKLEEDIREETGYAKWVDLHTKRISPSVTTMISKSQYAKEILEILK